MIAKETGVTMRAFIAYREWEFVDPLDGRVGVLRQEWRVSPLVSLAPEDITNAFGPDWQRYRPEACYVLEQHVVCRGDDWGWKPEHLANTYSEALEYVDMRATSCSDALTELWAARAAHARDIEEAKQAEAAKTAKEAERQEQKAASEAAFARLYNSSRWGYWAHCWRAYGTRVQEMAEPERQNTLNREGFREAHDAVLAAVTVPAKRKAIRLCLERFAPEWIIKPGVR